MDTSSFLPFLHCSLDFLGFSSIPGLEVGGYIDSMMNSTPLAYYGAILVTLVAVGWAYFWSQDKLGGKGSKAENMENSEHEVSEDPNNFNPIPTSFDISPMDECEFVPLFSHEEDNRIVSELALQSRCTPLNSDHLHGKFDDSQSETDSDDDSVNGEVLQHARNFTTEDITKYVNPKDLHVLDDPRESPSRRGSVMSRVKKARQRAIRNAVEREMTSEERMTEQMAANQMLARVYTVMRENKEVFGDTSFDDVKSQMDLYKA